APRSQIALLETLDRQGRASRRAGRSERTGRFGRKFRNGFRSWRTLARRRRGRPADSGGRARPREKGKRADPRSRAGQGAAIGNNEENFSEEDTMDFPVLLM